MNARSYVFTGSLIFLCVACENEFNPKGVFLDNVVVFGVISPNQTTQFVRVFSTYNPPGFNPLEHTSSNQIANATVAIQADSTVTALRDTTLPREDTGRYQDSIKAFVASPLTVSRGEVYNLTVTVPGYGTMTAMTTPPSLGLLQVDINTRASLTNPDVNRRDVIIYATPAPNAEGHMVKVFLEYEVVSQNPGIARLEEVPSLTTNYQDCLTYDFVFPRIRRRENVAGRELWILPSLSYHRTILKILKTYESEIVEFRRVIVVIVQADRHLYSYYSLVGGFRDEFSIRVDEPNYTNVQGGLGMFGSFTADSLSVTLPPDFPKITCPG